MMKTCFKTSVGSQVKIVLISFTNSVYMLRPASTLTPVYTPDIQCVLEYTEYPVCTLGGVSSKHTGNEPDFLPVCTLDKPVSALGIQYAH